MHSSWDNIGTRNSFIRCYSLTSFEATFIPGEIRALHTVWTNVTPAATGSVQALVI
jgi:hypothetical protein